MRGNTRPRTGRVLAGAFPGSATDAPRVRMRLADYNRVFKLYLDVVENALRAPGGRAAARPIQDLDRRHAAARNREFRAKVC